MRSSPTKAIIPVYSLRDRSPIGLEILQVNDIEIEDQQARLTAHRDEHYVLMLLEKGSFTMMVDFEEIKVKGPSILCILPGQVHHGIAVRSVKGWMVSADATYFNEAFRAALQMAADNKAPISITSHELLRLTQCITLLHSLFDQQNTGHFHDHTIRSLTDVYIGLFAGCYDSRAQEHHHTSPRPVLITRQFRQLLREQYSTIKSPAEYAALLSITPSYLNEVVKQTTGFPVSYWIHQEIILEAKRLLYYTDDTVKEIAYLLGYDDPAYFIRLFGKTAGVPPLQFRQRYRE